MRPTEQHWAILSFTRFLLALIVLSGHMYGEVEGSAAWTFVGIWFNQGSAVFGFLVISGYSIAASLQRSPEGFYRRRLIRIAPIYLLSIFVALVVGAYLGLSVSGWQLMASLLMLQGIAAPPLSLDGQLWTLAVEWWLYVAAPWFSRMPSYMLGVLASASFAANVWLKPADASKLLHGQALLCLAWYWLIGYLYFRHRHSAAGYLILFCPIAAAIFLHLFLGRAVFIGLLALAIADHVHLPQALVHPFKWLGDLSYPMYCLHSPLLALCAFSHVSSSALICLAVLTCATMACHFEPRARASLLFPLSSSAA